MAPSSTSVNFRNQQSISPLLWPINLAGQILEQAGRFLQSGQSQSSSAEGAKRFQIDFDQRQPLSFGKGDVSKMLEVVNDLMKHSPAAAVALADFVAQQDSPYSIDALRLLHMAKSFATPSQAMIAEGYAAVDQANQNRSLEEQATARLLLAEVQYLRFAHGDMTVPIGAVVQNLEVLAEGLAASLSVQRQAVARIILADLLLHRSQHKASNQQMALALVLVSQLTYGGKGLLELAQEFHPDIVDLTIATSSQQQLQSTRS